MTSPADIRVSQIVTTGGTQSRVELSEPAVAEYAAAMEEGTELPPIVVFHDGSAYWLADGFHRVMAANRANVEWLKADIRTGTKRDAILFSVGANATHGLPRTNADKRRSVEMLLADEEWSQWSNKEVARRCSVNPSLVDKMRHQLSTDKRQIENTNRKVERNGTVYTQRTENIGSRRGQVGARAEKTEAIRELAEQGHRSSQIASKVGLDEKTVRLYANEAGIELPDKAIGRVLKIDSRRVIEQTVLSLEASAQSLETISFSFDGITPAEALDWAGSISESLKVYRNFHKQLIEASRG